MAKKMIGHYEIRSKVGQGGMANVFLAYDTNLEREVAFKVLEAYFAREPEFAARFEREAKTITSLEHSHIVPLYDYGHFRGLPYLVMRYMRGGPLGKRLKEGPLAVAEAAPIIRRVASALDFAHEQGIIHRDLKPDNILFDRENNAFLADFGIVKLAESSTAFTQTGNTLGTPAYMSPEQAKAVEQLDHRSDIYSLGVILYEMLTGDVPYKADSNLGQAMMHVLEPVPRILEANPDLPGDCEAIIQKAMAKERDERYASAAELSDALIAVAQSHSTRTRQTAADPVPAEREPTARQMPAAAVVQDQPAAERVPEEAQQPLALPPQETAPLSPAVETPSPPIARRRMKDLVYLAPGITLMGVLQLMPLLMVVYLGFTAGNFTDLQFVGLENYLELLTDRLFAEAAGNAAVTAVSRSLAVLVIWWALGRSWNQRRRVPAWLALLAVMPLPFFSSTSTSILWRELSRQFWAGAGARWGLIAVDALHVLAFSAAVGLVAYALGQNHEDEKTTTRLLVTVRYVLLIILIATSANPLWNLIITGGNFGTYSLSTLNYHFTFRLLRVGRGAAGQMIQLSLAIIAAYLLWRTLRKRSPRLHIRANVAEPGANTTSIRSGKGLFILSLIPGIIIVTPFIWGLLSPATGGLAAISLAELPWGNWLANTLLSGLVVWLVMLPLAWTTAYGLMKRTASAGIFKSRIVVPFILSAMLGPVVIFVGQFYLLRPMGGIGTAWSPWLPLLFNGTTVLAFVLFFDGLDTESSPSLGQDQKGSLSFGRSTLHQAMPLIVLTGIGATCWAFHTFFWRWIATPSQEYDTISVGLLRYYSSSQGPTSAVVALTLMVALPCSLALGWATYKLLQRYTLIVES